MWTWILTGVAVLVVMVLGAYLIGRQLPKQHRAQESTIIAHQTPSMIAARITDVEHSGSWRRGVSATVISREERSIIFREKGPDGEVTYQQTVIEPGSHIRNEIMGEGLPYGGVWDVRIAPHGDGATVTIQEDGFLGPPLFRFLSRYVFGYNRSIRSYLRDLSAAAQ